MAHTLSPWTHENDCILNDPVTGKPVTGARIYGNGGYKVAEVFYAEPEDVRLMLAAPKLLEGYQRILSALRTSPMDDTELADLCRELIGQMKG